MNVTLSTKNTFLAILFLGVLALTARNVVDPDVWWHLRAGEYIAQHHAIPHSDPFSYTRSGQTWVAHEWLSELAIYELYRVTGFSGLILTFAAILTASFFILYLRCASKPYVAGITTLCAAWATAPVWGVRPQVISLLLTSLWLLILERSERNAKILWWTVPITLLWVNLHAGFALGLTLSGMFLVGELIENISSPAQSRAHLRTAAFVFFFDLLVVPLNPNGLRMFSYPIETLRSAGMQNYIAEWASPNFHRAEYWPYLLLLLASLGAFMITRISLRPRELILLALSLYASLASLRMIPLFVLIAVPLITQRVDEWPRQSGPVHSAWTRAVLNAVIVLAMAAFAFVRINEIILQQPQAEAKHFPIGAVGFLQDHPPLGALFNHYDWGGYLIWKLPATEVFIDGRADLYGEPLLHDFADAYQLRGSWLQVLERWHIQTVLVPIDSALATALQVAPGWTVAYKDDQAIILTSDSLTSSTKQVFLSPLGYSRYAINYTVAYFGG
jgi:hypothetical protein